MLSDMHTRTTHMHNMMYNVCSVYHNKPTAIRCRGGQFKTNIWSLIFRRYVSGL